MKHFYGYRRDRAEAEKTGAERFWIDMSPMRTEREALFHPVVLRDGDEIILFSLRDLGGAANADRVWAARVADRGATITLVEPDRPAKHIGRPRKYNPTPEQFRRHRAIWLDDTASEASKRQRISADYGSEVRRGMCNYRFGWPGREKPVPEWAQQKERDDASKS